MWEGRWSKVPEKVGKDGRVGTAPLPVKQEGRERMGVRPSSCLDQGDPV